jgi:hypothetical protein
MRSMMMAWCLGFVLALAGWSHAQAQIWTEFEPEGGRYRVLMPGTPQLSTAPISLGDGSAVQMYQAVVDAGEVAYLSTHVDYPATMIRQSSGETLLNNVRDGSAKGHTLVREKRLTIAGHPGREYMITQATGIVLVTRSFLVDNRLYQIIVAGRSGVEQDPDTAKFLESFTLLK